MEILKFFNREDSDYITYTLNPESWDELVSSLPVDVESCYVSSDHLNELVKKLKQSREQILKENYIPIRGSLRSGDFGEIFSYFLTLEKSGLDGRNLVGPKKWEIWKRIPDEPSPGADVILFHRVDPKKPKPEDTVVTVESKMRASKQQPEKNKIQEAVDHAVKDRDSRMAKTLERLRIQYSKTGDVDQLKFLERFRKPDEHGSFMRITKAYAIISSELIDAEKKKTLTLQDDVRVIVVSIERLLEMYEMVFQSITNSPRQDAE